MSSRVAVLLVCLVGVALGTMLCAPSAEAQTQLGTVSTPVPLAACPSLPSGASFDPTMTCFSANVSCPNTDQIGTIYGVSTPAGQLNGTIVMLSGDGGVYLPDSFEDYIEPTTIGQTTYQGYLGLSYQVIDRPCGAPYRERLSLPRTGNTRTLAPFSGVTHLTS